jgi:hypothetical protein
MKTIMNSLIIILGIVVSISGCIKDDNSVNSNVVNQDSTKNIYFIKSDLGGCNNQTMENIEYGEEKNDTVIIIVSNDTLQISIGLNYICCAPFKTESNTKNDSIFISITDTCPNPNNCYCRCYCYYTFDYYFDIKSDGQYYWKIILSDPREVNETIFDMGIIDVGE